MPKEIRLSNLELRSISQENNEMLIEGYAAVFNQATVLYKFDGIEYKEEIDKKAFDKCNMKDCCLKYNHSENFLILARVRGGSLELSVDDYGLYFKAKLFNTQSSRDVYEIIKAGGLDQCSFAFTVSNENYDRDTRTRTILGIDYLYDVAVCPLGAYGDATSVSARNFFQLEREKELLESKKREEIEQQRQKQKQKIKILLNLEV